MSTASIAVPEAFRYIFGAIATHTGDRRKEAVMDWARILVYVTGTVDQELLARNEYLATENRILKDQLMLSDAERATLGEIGHRLGRKGSRRGRDGRPAGHDPGLVPQAGRP